MLERRFAVFTAVTTFCLLLVGGIVHGTGSSLACPDWPTCFGTLMPEMKGGVFYEHSHRLLASAVGLLTIVLAVLVWRRRTERSLRFMAAAAVALVIFQGVLGGITVLYRLPTAVSSTHLGVSMVFFSWIVVLAWRLEPEGEVPPAPSPRDFAADGPLRWIALVTTLAYLQIVLGAVVRHTHAGLACVDIPLCQGSLWPVGAHGLVKLHMAHRLLGAVVALAVMGLSVYLLRRESTPPVQRVLAVLVPVLVVAQVTLGLLSVGTFLNLWVVTAHLGGGAALLAALVSLWTAGKRGATRPAS